MKNKKNWKSEEKNLKMKNEKRIEKNKKWRDVRGRRIKIIHEHVTWMGQWHSWEFTYNLPTI
jgi:hypothetical protein